MKKLIMIIGANSSADVSTTKEQVINYLGKRLAETDTEDPFAPIVVEDGDAIAVGDLKQIDTISKEGNCVGLVLNYNEEDWDSYIGTNRIVLATMSAFPSK